MPNSYFLDILKDKILLKTGFLKADFSNIPHIENQIRIAMKGGISASTLERFFGLVSNKASFYSTTLDILSEFAGYPSWQHLCKTHQIEDFKPSATQIYDDTDQKLLNLCLKNGHYDTILEFVEGLSVPFAKKTVFFSNYDACRDISWVVGKAVLTNKNASKALLPRLAQTQAGQYYFYEHFVCANDHYLDAIQAYYIPAINVKNQDYGLKDQAFAYSLLYERYQKAGKTRLMNTIGSRLFGNVQEEIADIHHLQDVRPYARFWAQKMVYLHHKKCLTNEKIDKIIHKLSDCKGTNEHPFAISQLIQSLDVVHKNELVIGIYEDFMKHNQPAKDSMSNDWYLGCMLLMWRIVLKAYIADNQVSKAQELANHILENNAKNIEVFTPQILLLKDFQHIITDFEKLRGM